MEATIALEYKCQKTAKAVVESVSPDNFKAPFGLQVKTEQQNNKVITHMECDCKLATFISTIDDLLFSASTAEKTLRSIKGLKP